jgi:hypothetical protein
MKTEQNKEITLEELKDVLSLTIKGDDANKLITFFCMLSAYTEDSQFNIILTGPTSAGKTYMASEVSKLFHQDDVMENSGSSPRAFYHMYEDIYEGEEYGDYEGKYFVDLERKIIIFQDQPNYELLANMRSISSKDKKEITTFIADKNKKGSNRTKQIIIIGFPSIIYCTADEKLNEQEKSRSFLLSPDMSDNKINESIAHTFKSQALGNSYLDKLYSDEGYGSLMQRVYDIKFENINEIIIEDYQLIEERYRSTTKDLQVRNNRDVKRLFSLIKSSALLNFCNRRRTKCGKNIFANEIDIENGFKLWNEVSKTENIGISPYLLGIYEKVIKPILKDTGITRKEVRSRYFDVYKNTLNESRLRQNILPALENAGLLYEEKIADDKTWYIFPGEKSA